MPDFRTKLSPPQLAKEWGISPDKVIAWINSGELVAINAATKIGGRPRYLIDVDDVAEFERRRKVKHPVQHRDRKKRTNSDLVEYV